MFWPHRRILKNSSGYHGECVKQQTSIDVLGASLGQVYQRLKLLKEQHMYVKLNKALISTHGVTECLKETFLCFTDSFVF